MANMSFKAFRENKISPCGGLKNQIFIKVGLILSRCKSGSIKSGQMIGRRRLEFE